MNEPELDIPEEFYAYKSRATNYIARLSGFPFQWALPDSPKTETGFPTRFFRWDQRRFRRLIEHAEHLIRCLIIWMAYVRLRSGLVRGFGLPPRDYTHMGRAQGCSREQLHQQSAGAERPEPQAMEPRSSITNKNLHIHPHFVLRGLPLYDQKLPAFRISLPESPSPGLGEGFGMRAGKTSFHLTPGPSPQRRGGRLRNDTVHTCDRLIERMERLGTLIEEIDARAARIAGIWLARMNKGELSRSPKWASGTQKTNVLAPGSSPGKAGKGSGLSNHTLWHPIPIKSPDPPPDILQVASDEERDDLLALHDAAIRAAELFSQRCG